MPIQLTAALKLKLLTPVNHKKALKIDINHPDQNKNH